MRQETIIKTYLKFNELTPKQQDKVIDKLYDINIDHDTWCEHIIQDYTDKLTALGFYKIKIEYNGFSSQGDGARFTAIHRKGDVKATTSMHYHYNTIQCNNPYIDAMAKRMSRRIYKTLTECYDYLTSREAIIETIEVNNYEFDQDTLQIG